MVPLVAAPESRFSEEIEREHEIRNLKDTVAALRDALEQQKAGTATEVAQAVAEAPCLCASGRF